jgi:hypothetical protein
LLFVTAARPCGPDFPSAVFVLTSGPDGSYDAYVAGQLGVPQSGYRTRHLVIAYDYLTKRPLSAEEQKQAIAADDHYASTWQGDDAQSADAASGASQWLAARTPFGQLDQDDPAAQPVSRSVPGQNYDSFDNCLSDAFVNAARTLQARVASYGAKDPAVLDWVRGQDAVFSNCGDGKPPEYYGPNKPTQPPPAPHAPAAVAADAPLWLKQDRAYQLAAAHFYALEFDAAIAGFRGIAADTKSPWSPIARYLIARCYIREASIGDDQLSNPQGDAAKQAAAEAAYRKTLALAQHELMTLRSAEGTDPRIAALHHATEGLLDYVNLRLQPDEQAIALAERLHGKPTEHFGQSLIDLTYLRYGPYDEPKTIGEAATKTDGTGMLAWIAAVSAGDEAESLKQWRATPNTAWLLAAMAFAQPTDAATRELVAAAKSIQPTDPGYTAIAYHRLRLQPQNAATRAELLTLMPRLAKDSNASTTNLFTALNAATAPTLNDWLAAAGRTPAGSSDDNGEVSNSPAAAPTAAAATDSANANAAVTEDVCGHRLAPNDAGKLFDTDAANAFNRDMPLRVLATAAESTILPANLRFQVAQAAWARALLLDGDGTNAKYEAIARRMEPVLLSCRATWKPVFDAYNAATTPEGRHAAALLALMRFASTEPSVRDGVERRGAFATYDEFRQNWWCSTVPLAGQTVDNLGDRPLPIHEGSDPTGSNENLRPPLFLTAADLSEAHTEVSTLEKIPNASTYFAQQALAWAKLHPKDGSTADILGEADRVLRNSCRKEAPFDDKTGKQLTDPNDMTLTPNLAKAIFTVLQRDYPNSPWAKRYKTWE